MSSESSDAPMTIGGLSIPDTTLYTAVDQLDFASTFASSSTVVPSDARLAIFESQPLFPPQQSTPDLVVIFSQVMYTNMMVIALMEQARLLKEKVDFEIALNGIEASLSQGKIANIERAGERKAATVIVAFVLSFIFGSVTALVLTARLVLC
ncbi:hypothetical protein BV25DRAFT_1922367 [Artomyces pyxidatus]|uniref:Uncharacterized protein n=1 Tax=Artomyces pyxidatus TaxID=48021 RepID=A0ACB8SEX7_9AGAM|nr:hypothetical protein BV25DRAFT_1922367 [Artomyces pyxidatus]